MAIASGDGGGRLTGGTEAGLLPNAKKARASCTSSSVA